MKEATTSALRQLMEAPAVTGSAVGSAGPSDAVRPGPGGRSLMPKRNTQRIGQILVSNGKMTEEQVEKVLAAQQTAELRFGEIAIKYRFVSRSDVDNALRLQFGFSHGERSLALPSRLVTAATPTAPFAEATRSLRSQLMMHWFDGTPGQSSLAITSVDRGDGKSFIAANLGVVFSQLGERTLVIDADLRHSTIHSLFGVRNRMGLSGVLAGRAGLEELVEPEGLQNLAVLPAGPLPPNPLELLGSEVFPLLLGELSARFDVILIDTPSAQQAADALVIAQRAKAALIVGRKDHTRAPELTQLASILTNSGVKLLGATLNEY